jgi:MFS family permease
MTKIVAPAQTVASVASVTSAPAFEALRLPGFRAFLGTFMLAMMADNIEHVISYWVVFQKFHSPGALNDRFDSRRIIQVGMALFITVSIGWGYFFVTDSLRVWHAMVLLVMHGFAGVLWQTSSQMLLYDIVGPAALPSAVRLNATARYLGVLVGPAVGGVIMLTLGPTHGIFLDGAFYLPLVVWLARAPYGRHFRKDAAPPRRAVRALADIFQTIGEVRRVPVLGAMILLAGGASFFIGNSYQAQMPGFATDVGHGNPGAAYSMLLAADAAGALTAGVLLESRGGGLMRTQVASALRLAMLWAAALACFACARSYPAALALLFTAGFFELSFSSMTQTLVQLHAPTEIRGRVLGLFNMAALGMRAFSGVTVGLAGSLVTVHVSLAASAILFIAVTALLLWRFRSRGVPASRERS